MITRIHLHHGTGATGHGGPGSPKAVSEHRAIWPGERATLVIPTPPPCTPVGASLQGYLAHRKRPPRRTLQYDHPEGPVVALGEKPFFMMEVPL